MAPGKKGIMFLIPFFEFARPESDLTSVPGGMETCKRGRFLT